MFLVLWRLRVLMLSASSVVQSFRLIFSLVWAEYWPFLFYCHMQLGYFVFLSMQEKLGIAFVSLRLCKWVCVHIPLPFEIFGALTGIHSRWGFHSGNLKFSVRLPWCLGLLVYLERVKIFIVQIASLSIFFVFYT